MIVVGLLNGWVAVAVEAQGLRLKEESKSWLVCAGMKGIGIMLGARLVRLSLIFLCPCLCILGNLYFPFSTI